MRKKWIKYITCWSGIFCLMLILSCRKSPTDWNTSWTAPVGNGKITIEQIIGQHQLAVDENGWYHLVLDTTITDFGWEDLVTVEDTTITKSYSMPFTLDVPPGVNIIDQFQNESFLNTGSSALRKLYLKSGKLKYKLYNHVDGQIKCTYQLPSAYINGQPIQLMAVALPGTATNAFVMEGEIDLAGCQMDLSGTTGFSINELKSHIIIQTDPSASSAAHVHAGDQVKVEMEFVDPVVLYAKGYFGSQEKEFNRDVNLFSSLKSGQAVFEGGFMQMNFSNFIGMDAFFELDTCRFKGVNGVTTDLIHPIIGVNQSIVRATETAFGISPTQWQLDISDDNSNVIECMESLPTKMNIKAKAHFNPFGNVNAYNDFIHTDQIAQVRLLTDIPLRMAFQDVVVESKIGLDVNNASVSQGKIMVRLDNAFPLDVNAKIFIGEMVNNMELGVVEIPAATLDMTSFMSTPQTASFEIQCNEEQLNRLMEKKLLTIQWILNTPYFPNLVGFRPGYYLEAVAVGQADIQLTVGDE